MSKAKIMNSMISAGSIINGTIIDSVIGRNVVVKKGPAELRKQVHGAVIIRQKYAIRRLNGGIQ